MRGLTLDEAAKGLGVHQFYLSSVESGKSNISGKIAMAVLDFYDVSFEQIYDVKKTLTLDTVEETFQSVEVEVILSELEILSDSIKAEEKILEELLKKNINAQVYSYEIIDKKKTFKHGFFLCKINVELIVQEIVKKEFDINFFRDSNIELTDILLKRGFPEQTRNINLNKDKFKIVKDEIYLPSSFKIVSSDDIIITNKINISGLMPLNGNEYVLNNDIKIIKNDKNEIETVNLTVLEETMNNLKFIEKYLKENEGLNVSDVPKLLGLSFPGYSNLVNGNQKVSAKVMWRMIKLFRVPLELILNTRRYMDEMYQDNILENL